MPEHSPLYTVQTDIYIARRTRLHAVHDQFGTPVYHGPHLMNVFDWLFENDITTARFTDEESAYLVTLERAPLDPPSEETSKNG